MGGVVYPYLFASPFGVQGNGVVSKDRETNHPFVTDNLDAVFSGGIISHETTGAAAHQSVIEFETSAQRIIGRIKSAPVAFVAP